MTLIFFLREMVANKMEIKRSFWFFVAVCFFVGVQPLHVYADECDDVANKASEIFMEARDAGGHGDFDTAAELYEEAERYYQEASEMKNCRCPKIENSASNNVEICRKNAEISRNAQTEKEAAEIFNQAREIFNEGNSYARNQEWEMAVMSFEEAEMLWRSIDSSSINAGNAMQNADQASELTEKARQRM